MIIILEMVFSTRFKFSIFFIVSSSSDKYKRRCLKDTYENFLEEEKLRLARNDRLLQTMEDIDYRAGTLAAKTERLKLLKVCTPRSLFCELLRSIWWRRHTSRMSRANIL